VDYAEVFRTRSTHVAELAHRARWSLGLWRGVFYTVGIAAVVAATLAGASSLASLGGEVVAGFLALAAAVLASVDKFLGAVNRVNTAGRRHEALSALEQRLTGLAAQALCRVDEIAATSDDMAKTKLQEDAAAWFSIEITNVEERLQKVLQPGGPDADYLT
jgi:hypothetical protein